MARYLRNWVCLAPASEGGGGGGGAGGAAADDKGGAAPPANAKDKGAPAGDIAGDQAAGDVNEFLADLPDDIKNDPALATFKDKNALAKSYLATKKLVGGDVVRKPGEKATDEERLATMRALGAPEKPEEYKLPEGFEVPEGAQRDEGTEGQFAEIAAQVGLLPHQHQALVKWWYDVAAEGGKAGERATAARLAEQDTAVKQHFGPALKERIAGVKGFLAIHDPKGEMRAVLKQHGLNNHPAIVKFFDAQRMRLSAERGLSGGEGGGAPMTPGEAKAKIAAIRSDPKHDYNAGAPGSPAYEKARAEMSALYKLAGE